jgi:hypothetical protein
MSSKNLSDRQNKSSANSHLKSSLVHKPFATGTINIFNPHRNKEGNKLSSPKLYLDAELEPDLDLQPKEIEVPTHTWLNSLLSPWGISAIAMLLLINLISGGFIWRYARNAATPNEVQTSTIGMKNFTKQEFMPLNLNTLGAIETGADEAVESTPDLAPIAPALAPLNNIAGLSSVNTDYYYILTEYTGEQSLLLARQQVAQVSLVNFPQGVFVYLGAFKNREDAENYISHLKQENFSAQIYPLD